MNVGLLNCCEMARLLLNILQSVMLHVDELLYRLCYCYNILLCTNLFYGAESLKSYHFLR